MGWAGNKSETTCPFINGEDHRCGRRLTLGQLDEAFTYCLGGYLACPTYHQLSWEQQDLESTPLTNAARPTRPGVAARLTIAGQPHAPAAPRLTLRAAGT